MRNLAMIIIMTAGLFLILSLSPGCRGDFSEEEDIIYLHLATGGMNSFYDSLGQEVATHLTKEGSRIHIIAEQTAGPEANLRTLSKDGLQLAITTSDLAYHAREGKEMYQDGDAQKFVTIASLASEPLLILSYKSKEVTEIGELAEKKISLGRGDGRTQLLASYLLGSLLIEPDKNKIVFYDEEEALLALDEKRLDAAFLLNPFSSGQRNLEYSPLPLTEDNREMLESEHSFFTTTILPEGMFSEQEEEILAVAVEVILVASADVDEDILAELSDNLARAGFSQNSLTLP